VEGTPATPAPAAPGPQPDPGVSTAFALGWQVAALFRDPTTQAPDETQPSDELPGFGDLTRSQFTELGLDQIDAGLARLTPRIAAAGLEPPDTKPLRSAFRGEPDPIAHRPQDMRECLRGIHLKMLDKLTAADFRLGKAYRLGRALADACEADGKESLERHFEPGHVEHVRELLADIDSVLPAHTSKAVRESLLKWRDWVATPTLGKAEFDWERDRGEVRTALRRQGQRWRSLLSGEKAARDMLSDKDYLDAIRTAAARARGTVGRVLLAMWPLVLLIVGLVGVGIYALAQSDTAMSQIIAIGGFAASLGISWKGIGGALAKATTQLEEPLWGAALNVVIATAVTCLPGEIA
jgi:hypothetical protein